MIKPLKLIGIVCLITYTVFDLIVHERFAFTYEIIQKYLHNGLASLILNPALLTQLCNYIKLDFLHMAKVKHVKSNE